MDITGLTKKDFKAWVEMDDEVAVLLRYTPRDMLAEIGKQAVVVTIGRDKQETKEYDAIKADVDIALAAVVDWRGLEVDGAPFPCTPENIELLVRKWSVFARFIGGACVDIAGIAAAQKEHREKN